LDLTEQGDIPEGLLAHSFMVAQRSGVHYRSRFRHGELRISGASALLGCRWRRQKAGPGWQLGESEGLGEPANNSQT
jgi:hypothetical protein